MLTGATRGTEARERGGDDGFTLIELLISIAVLAVIMIGLAAVMFGAMSSNVQTKVRLDETRDQQFAAAYFGTDAQAATSISTDPVATCGTAPGTTVVEFRGASYDAATYAASFTVVSYVFTVANVDGKPAGQLRRQSCETPIVPAPTYPLAVKTSTLVAGNLAISVPTSLCSPAPCGPTTASVTLSASRRTGEAPFKIIGTRRTTP